MLGGDAAAVALAMPINGLTIRGNFFFHCVDVFGYYLRSRYSRFTDHRNHRHQALSYYKSVRNATRVRIVETSAAPLCTTGEALEAAAAGAVFLPADPAPTAAVPVATAPVASVVAPDAAVLLLDVMTLDRSIVSQLVEMGTLPSVEASTLK